jgi:hypothetical protein
MIIPITSAASLDFEKGLKASNYMYDQHVGSWMKEDSDGNLHTYMHIENDDWIYEKYDVNDKEIVSKAFTL